MQHQTPSQALEHGREIIRALAFQHRTKNPRVFGPVLTGQDSHENELNILVDTVPETTLFDLGGLQEALEDALGVHVDVRTPLELPADIRADVLRHALPV